MKKILFLSCLVLSKIFTYGQFEFPNNSPDNVTVSNWVIAKTSDFDEKNRKSIIKNTSSYFLKIPENSKRNLNLSKYHNVVISLSQIYEDINYNSTFIAACDYEVSEESVFGIEFFSIDLDTRIYINGDEVFSNYRGDNSEFDLKLRKGTNKIVLIGKPHGNYFSAFCLNIKNNEIWKPVTVIAEDIVGNKIPYRYIITEDKATVDFRQLNENSQYKQWLKKGEYTFYCFDGDNYGYKKIKIEDKLINNIKIKTKYKRSISGKIYTMDRKTVQPGIYVELINIENNQSNWIQYSDISGNFSISCPAGKYNIRIYANDKFQYHLTNGEKTLIKISDDYSKKYELDFFITNQVKGSWGKITQFDGMYSNGAHVSLVSSEDLLYLGTYNGISVYDGLSVKSYNYDQGLPNGFIGELFEDSKGHIWIGYGDKGLVKWKNGKVLKYLTKDDGLPSNNINALAEDNEGKLYIGTSHGLSVYDGKKFKNYNFTDGLGNGFVTDIKVIGSNVWIGCGMRAKTGGNVAIGGGISMLKGNKIKSFDLSSLKNIKENMQTITVINEDKSGNLLFGTWAGIVKYDGSSFSITDMKGVLPSNFIQDILIDDNKMWVATNKGLTVIDQLGGKIIIPIEKDKLLQEDIQSISKSRDGVYFVGTSTGVYLYDPYSFQTITSYEGIPVAENWMSGILDIDIDNNGYLWIASGEFGIFKLKNGVIVEHFNSDNSEIPQNYTCQIKFSKDGSVWFAHPYGGISKYSNGKIQNMTEYLKIPSNTVTSDIAFDSEGTIWIATSRGLGMFKNDSLAIFNEKDGLVRPFAECDVNVGYNDEIIYNTYGSGFSIYKDGKFTNYDESNGLADNRIWDLAIDSENNYWLALDGQGVQKFDGEKFFHYNISDGVTAGETFRAYVDEFDNVWIGTFGGGVCYYDGGIWNSVDTRDGLLDNTVGSICSIDGNRYWFGSQKGITLYMPKKKAPNVSISKIKTASGSYNSLEELKENKGKILENTRITFNLNSNSFNTKKEKQKYLVSVIKGGEIETKLVKTNEFEFFPKKIGKYNIELQSIDRDMNYSKIKSIEIKVVGPWYKNLATAIPFWGFLLLLISLSGYSSNKYLSQRKYTAKLKEEAQIKDREARERLEEKNKEIVDSINYAKRIQDAMMTSEGYRKSVIPKSFTFFKPKDVVSGDFYWVFKDKDENIFFTVADCTGHGVPGAFMSMIGTSLLNEIIVEKGIKETNKILDEMRALIIKSLNQDDNDDQKDGMDISICKLNLKKNSLEFSGAHNPLLVVSKGEIKTYKGDSQAVGLETLNIKPFSKHTLKLQKNDMIYIYSDGYQDQFGGENGKKYMAANFKKFLLKISKEEEKKQNKLLEIELANWMKNEEQIDDICIMGVRV